MALRTTGKRFLISGIILIIIGIIITVTVAVTTRLFVFVFPLTMPIIGTIFIIRGVQMMNRANAMTIVQYA